MPSAIESDSSQPNRRQFVRASAGIGLAGIAALGTVNQLAAAETKSAAKSADMLFKPGDTILFQGDSITDAGRKRDVAAANSDVALGHGYAWLAAAELLVGMPDAKLKIFNRGVSGDKVYQLAARWQTDCLDLKPNVLSILIGVNDYWHKHAGKYDGTVEKYEADYRALLKRTKNALPKVKLVICEPFVLKVGQVDDSWFPEFPKYREAAQRVAKSFGAAFVPYQAMFDAAVKIAAPGVWAADGVHPTGDGAALMADWWLEAVGAELRRRNMLAV